MRTLSQALSKRGSTAKESLIAYADKTEKAVTLEIQVWWLNAIAFCGYAVFPLTYFCGYVRTDAWEWWGNFAGDFAWTVEPALVLAAAGAFSLEASSAKEKEKDL